MKLINILLFNLMFLFIVGCGKKENKVIKIGAIFSLTGDVGAYGQRSKKGFELAVDIINKKGGINGKKIVPIIEDAKSQSKDGITAYRKLVDVDKVKIIVGDVLSSTTMAIVPMLEKNKILLFAPGASNPKLKGASPYFFRNWVSDDFDGFAMANYMYETEIYDCAIIVQQSDYTLGLANAFQGEFKKLGGTILLRYEFATNETNFRSLLSFFKLKKIKTVFLVGQSKEDGNLLKQAKEMNFSPQWFTNLTVETPECATIAGNAREGAIFSTPAFDLNSSDSVIIEFKNKFKKKYNEVPEATAGHAYDAVMILAKVFKEVGTDVEKVREALLKVKNFRGVTGITTFDSNGDVIKDVFIKQIKNSQSILLKHYKF